MHPIPKPIHRLVLPSLSVSITLWLSGCATPTPDAPAAERSGVADLAATAAAREERNPAPYPDTGWLADFDQPELEALVNEALSHNFDLQAAAARLDASTAALRAAGAALQPTLALGSDAGRGGRSSQSASNALGLGLNVTWEVDLWGRLRSQQQAAASDLSVSAELLAAARQSLAAQVAKAWFLALETDALAEISANIFKAYQEQVRVVSAQVEAGLAEPQDLNLLRTAVAQAEDGSLQSTYAHAEALRSLEMILGRYPSADFPLNETKVVPPRPIPVGLPAEVLDRRPDLRAAEAKVAAAFFRTAEANAARLPSITLTGGVAGASADLNQLLRPDNVAWTLGANLLGPIFDGGRRSALVDQADANQRAAIAEYGQKALGAFREVETSLALEASLTARHRAVEATERSAAEALRVARARYDAGVEDLLALLQIQERYESARLSLVSLGFERLRTRVDLHLAIGGSFAREDPQP